MAEYQQLINNLILKNKGGKLQGSNLKDSADDPKKSTGQLSGTSDPVVVVSVPKKPEAKKTRQPTGNKFLKGAVLTNQRPRAEAENVRPAAAKPQSFGFAQALAQNIQASATQRKTKIHSMVHGIVDNFNKQITKTLTTEDALKKKKLIDIASGLMEARDSAVKLSASMADQTKKFSKTMENHFKCLEIIKQHEVINAKKIQSTLDSISVEIGHLEMGRSNNIYTEETKPLIAEIDAMIEKLQLDQVKHALNSKSAAIL